MVANIITAEDLQAFRKQLLADIEALLTQRHPLPSQRWLKSHQVMRLLAISTGTLQHMRVTGALPFTKIGGVLFYESADIEKMLQARKRNPNANNQETLHSKRSNPK